MKKNETNKEKEYYQPIILKKDNKIVDGKYQATLFELRITYMAMLWLQQGKFEDKDDGYYVHFNSNELGKYINIKGGSGFKELEDIAYDMSNRQIGVIDEEKEYFSFINLIIEATYEDKIFTVVFNKKINILYPKLNYTPLPLDMILSLKSEYSFRLYEVLKKICFYPSNYKGVKNWKFKVETSLAELKFTLGVVDASRREIAKEFKNKKQPDYDRALTIIKEQKYEDWKNFKARCLDKPIKEINQKTDISVAYNTIRSGKGGKITSIEFLVSLKSPLETYTEINLEPIINAANEILRKKNINLNKFELTEICMAAKTNLDIIEKAGNFILTYNSPITNMVGLILDFIENNGYSKDNNVDEKQKKGLVERKNTTSKKYKENKPKNKFHNFPQREYNFNELERILLEKNKNK